MKTLLIFPAQWYPTQPYLSTPYLTAYLRAKGWDVDQRDFNIASYDHFLSAPLLQKAEKLMAQRLQSLKSQNSLSMKEKSHLDVLATGLKFSDRIIAGVDEAGRGPLAGPVVAGVAVLPVSPSPRWSRIVRDSKLLTPAERETAFAFLQRNALSVATGMADHVEIDRLGIAPATRLAMSRAVNALPLRPQFLLLDAFPLPELDIPQKAIVHGDALCLSIAAASVVAKVTRDRIMASLGSRYPEFGWERNAAYPSREHLDALQKHGITPHHRQSFNPIKKIIAANG